MFDELKKYKENGHFFLTPNHNLKEVCTAPSGKSGVYIIYALQMGRINLVYIGRSGKKNNNGTMFIRKAGLGGIKDRIVNGHQPSQGKIPRRILWPKQMIGDGIDALDIYWYVTHGTSYCDCPLMLEKKLLSRYMQIYGELPEWNHTM